MISPLVSRSPQCVACIRRMAGGLGERCGFPATQQVRGKKRLARTPNKVNALLREDIDGYGRQGTVVSIAAGVMRNQLFPKKQAEYATDAKLQELGLKKEDIVQLDRAAENKSAIDGRAARKLAKAEAKAQDKANAALKGTIPAWEQVKPIELELLSPEEATSIVTKILPPNLDFYRPPITTAQPTTKKISPSLQSKAVISAAAAEVSGSDKSQKTTIYGSVSTSDIAASLKAILAEDRDGARVVLSPEEISFVEETDEKDRVKHLGIFEIDIRLKGAPDAIRRTIKVNAQG